MLAQIGEEIWVDPMKVIHVHPRPEGEATPGNEQYISVVHVEGCKLPTGSEWTVAKIVEQLNGRTK
jgi:hypothetical protein